LVVSCTAGAALGLDAERNIDQYGHEIWTSEAGLPGEAVYQILQTPDGYLWLRTSAGLVRFDGVRFVRVIPVVGNEEIREPVKAICLGADGDLLVRTVARTLIYRSGAFSDYLPRGPLPDGDIRHIFETREHEFLIGSDAYIYLVQGSHILPLRTSTAWVDGFVQDHTGAVWIGALSGLFAYRDSQVSLQKTGSKELSIATLFEDHEHALWVGALDGLYRFVGDKQAPRRVAPTLIHDQAQAICEDRQGNLWVATSGGGLYRRSGGKWSSYTVLDDLTDNNVLSLYEDREGSLWVGTASGLERFRDTKLTPFTMKEGLLSNLTAEVLQGHDGSVYIFSQGGGLTRIKNGVLKHFTAKDGLGSNFGGSLYEAMDGSLWIGTTAGLTHLKDEQLTNYQGDGRLSKYYISAINEDSEGLIVTTSEPNAFRFRDGTVRPLTFRGQATPLSQPGCYTFVIYRDPTGTLWFGTVKGLFKFSPNEPLENARQGPISFPVTSLHDDQEGNLWLAGRVPGITKFRKSDGRVTRYAQREGLFDESPTRILTDRHDNLWMSTADGIYMVSRADLDAVAEGRIPSVTLIHYGSQDGMKTSEASPETNQPAGWRMQDGKLWFTTRKGAVIVDPDKIARNALSPPVIVEDFVVDGQSLALHPNLEVAPGKRRFEFHYTALSLLIPQRVQFRYKLEGYDRDWVDPGLRRVAYYTNLPPGTYRFLVTASNDDGVWNTAGASAGFVLRPHFYQTLWFYGLCALGVLLCAVGGQRLHTRRLRLRAEELGRIVDERTRDLQAQKTFLRQVIDIMPNFIFVKDRQGRFTLANRALAEACSRPVEEIIGKTDAEINPHQEEAAGFHRDDMEVLDMMEEKVVPEEKNTDTEGRVRWLQTVKRPFVSEDGKSVLLLGVATDITERKQAEQQLRLQAAALESAASAIVITDRDGTILWVNAAFTKLTGYSAEEAIGHNPRILRSGEQPRSFYEAMWKRLLAGDTWRGEIINRRKDGQLYTEEMTITPVRDTEGNIEHFIAIKQDVTEQRALERQLRQAQKMEAIGQLAGGVAHDFHNLMGVILGYCEILEGQCSATDPSRKKIEQMHKAATRAVSLTGQLLAFSRQQMLQPVVLDLNAIILEMEKMLSRLIGEDIHVVTLLQPGLGNVRADPSQIGQVLMNLALNARDAMPGGGQLTIETADVEIDEAYARLHADAVPGRYVMLAVGDTGTGMSKETLAHIFEPFFTTKGVGKGTGLGLSTVYGVVKQSGGHIWVYSELGHGTTFKIYLPRIEREEVDKKAGKSAAATGGSETILLVEDFVPLLELACELLESCGYNVLHSRDPLEAIRIAEQHEGPIPLLVTDVVMPKMSGRTLAQKLRALRPDMRVLYISGYTDDVVLRYGDFGPGQAFLQKPFTKDNLAARIRELLGPVLG
jgi:PAS domain S-box-containing protein